MKDTIISSDPSTHVGPVDICCKLLRECRRHRNAANGFLRIWKYGYDWRLRPDLLAKRLTEFLEGLPCNARDVSVEKKGVFVISHSLGGLLTRHIVNQRPELFAGVLYAGTPQHCINILGPTS